MPTLLRELAAPFANDPDYEALQTTPAVIGASAAAFVDGESASGA